MNVSLREGQQMKVIITLNSLTKTIDEIVLLVDDVEETQLLLGSYEFCFYFKLVRYITCQQPISLII